MQGWITLHRKIEENELWLSEPFTRGQAWVDLLLIANHKSQLLYKRNIPVLIERGQVGWSKDALAKRWGWGIKKVTTFLKYLEKEQQIIIINNYTLSRIIVVNYNKYQKKEQQSHNSRTTEDINNNNVNNVNNTISDKSPTEKDMAWNKQPEDEAEVSIDFDSGEEIKPKEKQKRHYKEVYTIFEEVLGKQPANWLVNVTQQKCAENLFTERGVKAIRNALEFYKEHKDEEFCPLITQPSDLDAKWSKLGEFKKKLQ